MQAVLDVLAWLLLAVAVVLAVPVAVLTIQICSALLARSAAPSPSKLPVAARRPVIAVLMPAHDEAAGIAVSIASVTAQLTARDRLLVVADNCSDGTARVATGAGAEVVERTDPERRGKGFALDCGVRHLAQAPPAIVIIVDADCTVAPEAIDRLAQVCTKSGRPVQALYLMRSAPAASLRTRIAEFAWVVKNEVRPSGFHRLGLPCQLMGSGMAFPWAVISKAPLASGHIVEDLQLGLELAARGTAPLFCGSALVSSVFPAGPAGLASQRTRWEHGHLSVIATMGPRLLWRALTRRQSALAAMVLDVCVPPLAALVLALSVAVVSAAAVALAGADNSAFIVAGVSTCLLVAAVAAAWYGFGRTVVSFGELATAPLYALAKVPMYLRMVRQRQTEWVRTRRDDGRH